MIDDCIETPQLPLPMRDALRTDPTHRDRYIRFMADTVYGERPEFDEAMGTVTAVVDDAWQA